MTILLPEGIWPYANSLFSKHDSELGNAPAYKLFDTIHVQKKDGVIAPRNYTDYDITVDESKIPEHVTCTRMI